MDGRTTDARATALALLTQSSRANKKWQLQVATLYHVYQGLFGDMAGTGMCDNREPVFAIS